jgi:hypothetical protein
MNSMESINGMRLCMGYHFNWLNFQVPEWILRVYSYISVAHPGQYSQIW